MTVHLAYPARSDLLPEIVGLHRPRLRAVTPVLWRTSTTIGLGDRVIVDRVSRADASWLSSLDGLRTRKEIEAELPIPPDQARRLLRAALAAAALEDAATLPDSIRWAPPAHRDAEWGRVAAAIDAAGSVADGLGSIRNRGTCAVSVQGDDPLADQFRLVLEWAGLSAPASRSRTVTALVRATHPDLPPAGGLEGECLTISVWGRRAVVEPIPVPGRTGCPRCRQLHLRDADPAWPLLAVQWGQAIARLAPRPVDPFVGALAAVHAVASIRRWADGGPPEHTAVEVSAADPLVRRVARPPHPLCGCRWTAAPTAGGPPDSAPSATM